jgi:hypothetical protein
MTIIKAQNKQEASKMKMLKMMLVTVLTFGLLGSCAAVAWAEMFLGISGSTGQTDFTSSYSGTLGGYGLVGTNDSEADTISAKVDLNLFLLRIYVDASKTTFSESNFYKIGLGAGWELGPDILRLNLFAAGKGYIFEDYSNPAGDVRNVFYSLGGGAGVSSKIGKLKLYGKVFIPVFTKYTNEYLAANDSDSSAEMNYLEAGLSLATIPFVDIFVSYHQEGATADDFDFDATTYSAGVKISL